MRQGRGGQSERAEMGRLRRVLQGSCVRGWLIENGGVVGGGGGGGGGLLWCMWATKGTPGSRRVAGGEISLL